MAARRRRGRDGVRILRKRPRAMRFPRRG